MAGTGVVVPRELCAWDDILILMVLGSFDTLGCVFWALAEAGACTWVLVSCCNDKDGVGASAKLGVSLAVTSTGVVGEVVGVDVCIAGDFEAFFLPVERAIL